VRCEGRFGLASNDEAAAVTSDVERAELLALVTRALARSWSRDTSAVPDVWSEKTPALGQCAVSALVVQDLFGGELLRCDVGLTSHYWNGLPTGGEVDLTRHQFGSDFHPRSVENRSRDYVLSFPNTRTRYAKLRRRVTAWLSSRNEPSALEPTWRPSMARANRLTLP